MTTATRTRKPRPSKPDTCRLTVRIRGTDYSARPLDSEDGRAWRLRKADGTAYDVAETPYGPTCDCGDQTFRHEGETPSVASTSGPVGPGADRLNGFESHPPPGLGNPPRPGDFASWMKMASVVV